MCQTSKRIAACHAKLASAHGLPVKNKTTFEVILEFLKDTSRLKVKLTVLGFLVIY